MPKTSTNDSSKQDERWCLFVFLLSVGVLACVLRWIGLLDRSLWFDETMSWRTTQLGWKEMMQSITRNTHPPLYFVLLKVWVSSLGDSLIALRGLNLLIATLTPVAVWGFVHEGTGIEADESCGSAKAVTPAMLLFALSSFQIRLVADVRMYPLMVLLTLVSSWLMLRAMAEPHLRWRWISFGATSLAMPLTHYFGLFVAVGQFMFLASWSLRGSKARAVSAAGVVIAFAVVVVGWSVWIPTFLRQRGQVARGWWTDELSMHDLQATAIDLVASPRVLDSNSGLHVVIATAGLLVVPFVLLLHPNRFRLYLVTVMTVASGLAIVSSTFGTNIVIARYFAPMQILWLVGLAICIADIRWMFWRCVVMTSVAGLMLACYAANLVSEDARGRPGISAAVAMVESRFRVGDRILADRTWTYFPAQYHALSRDRISLLIEDHGASYFTGKPVLRADETLAWYELQDDPCQRIWWLSAEVAGSEVLNRDWIVRERVFFPGSAPFQESLSVTLYERRLTANDE